MEEIWLVVNAHRIVVYLIPISAILGAFAVGIVAMILASRNKEQAHRERMFLAEKGMEIPKELYGNQRPKEPKTRDFRVLRTWLLVLGILTIFIGIATIITIGVQDSVSDGIGGIFPILIGVAFLVSERLILRNVIRSEP